MFGASAAYVVALSAMTFSAASAFTLFWFVRHLDPPVTTGHEPAVPAMPERLSA